jgi:hypothetical protein
MFDGRRIAPQKERINLVKWAIMHIPNNKE